MVDRYQTRPISDRAPFTGKHQQSQFTARWTDTRALLLREVTHLSGRDLVLEIDVMESMLRLDGELYAHAKPLSPAVRVAFGSKHGPLIYATDKFWGWQDNVRAIALSLESLRRVDRYGVSERGEQYTGWKAIGTGSAIELDGGMDEDQAWAILGSFSDHPVSVARQGDPRPLLRAARAFAHPDRHGGDRTLWDQVEQAAKVLKVLT